jgi:hypothetical protein
VPVQQMLGLHVELQHQSVCAGTHTNECCERLARASHLHVALGASKTRHETARQALAQWYAHHPPNEGQAERLHIAAAAACPVLQRAGTVVLSRRHAIAHGLPRAVQNGVGTRHAAARRPMPCRQGAEQQCQIAVLVNTSMIGVAAQCRYQMGQRMADAQEAWGHGSMVGGRATGGRQLLGPGTCRAS